METDRREVKPMNIFNDDFAESISSFATQAIDAVCSVGKALQNGLGIAATAVTLTIASPVDLTGLSTGLPPTCKIPSSIGTTAGTLDTALADASFDMPSVTLTKEGAL